MNAAKNAAKNAMEYAPENLTNAVDRRVAELGFELVDIRRRDLRGRTVLQIRIDVEGSAPGSGVTADDCANVSRELEAWLDGSQMLGARYVLEVSSPGIERPIRFLRHWERFVGQKVRVRVPGRGREIATIVRIPDQSTVMLRFGTNGEEQIVPLKKAKDATLVVDWSTLDRSLARKASKESQ